MTESLEERRRLERRQFYHDMGYGYKYLGMDKLTFIPLDMFGVYYLYEEV